MKDSGYSEKFRWEVIDAGVKAHREQERMDKAGIKKMFRKRVEEREKRNKAKEEKKKNWSKNKGKRGGDKKISTVMMVPYTVGGELVKRMKKATAGGGGEIKFVEMSWYSLQNTLEQADPFKEETCGRRLQDERSRISDKMQRICRCRS